MTAAAGVRERLEETRAVIAASARRAGRSDEVKLVAVTKTVAPDLIVKAYAAGQRLFGENRIQEAVEKIESLTSSMPDAVWHLIGHLQSNKAKQAVAHFPVIESVDSVKLARRLDGYAASAGRHTQVLLEVNVAGEASKSGFDLETLRRSLPDLMRLSHLDLRGLMTIAPLAPDPQEVRWVFRTLREVRDDLRETYALSGFDELSMGMSGDFPVAIEEGATIVRIGRALFGERT
jgi:pyridoxal phosphate enzyme (YggS family)